MDGLHLSDATVKLMAGGSEEKTLLDQVNLTIHPGEFVTVLGGNGAGKSTLFNVISGSMAVTQGQITLQNETITRLSEEERARKISRVFQDPKMGTAPRMTVAENLLIAQQRGKARGLKFRKIQQNKQYFFELCQQIGNGLEHHLDTPTGNLSGGQRQALSLLMATILSPELLLLDEHTAALDPKTSKQLMELTAKIVAEKKLTCLMITHRMEDALSYGNRLLVLKKGRIVKDLSKTEKQSLTIQDLLYFFEEIN